MHYSGNRKLMQSEIDYLENWERVKRFSGLPVCAAPSAVYAAAAQCCGQPSTGCAPRCFIACTGSVVRPREQHLSPEGEGRPRYHEHPDTQEPRLHGHRVGADRNLWVLPVRRGPAGIPAPRRTPRPGRKQASQGGAGRFSERLAAPTQRSEQPAPRGCARGAAWRSPFQSGRWFPARSG